MKHLALGCVFGLLYGCRADTPPRADTPLPERPAAVATAETGSTGAPTAPTPCVAPGCLKAAQSLGAVPHAELQALIDPALTIDNGYEVFSIEYWTDGARWATATVTLPIDAEPPADGWPLVANNHGTVGFDDPCRLSGTVSGAGLAGLFGARGAIGVAPDYPGLGGPGRHRYLDLRDEATSVLDALRAAQALAQEQGVLASDRVAVVGLSQGGHAALGAAAWQSRYAPELDLRAVGVSGPASGWLEHWSAGVQVPGTHQVLHALRAAALADEAGVDPAPLWAAGFDPMPHLLGRCGWDPDFSGDPTLYDDFPTRPGEVFAPAFLAAYTSGDLTDFAYVAEGFTEDRVGPWLDVGAQTAPIAVWQGDRDPVVPWADTAALVDALRAGGVDVTLTTVPGGGHVDVAFGFLASAERATDSSLRWVRERLEAP